MTTASRGTFARPSVPLVLALVLALCLLANGASAQVSFGSGPLVVEVNEAGLLVQVPAAGLTTVDGPAVLLVDDVAEWFGVSFVADGQAIAAVGAGASADWAGRREVEPLTIEAGVDRLVVVTSVGDLRIETLFRLDPDGPHLLASARLVNVGDDVLRDIVYTREWRSADGAGWTFPRDLTLPPAPPDVCRVAWMLDDLPPGGSGGAGFSYRPATAAPPESGLAPQVPLALWTSPAFPDGLTFGDTNGISWGDHDADGWPDVCAMQSGNLWRNLQGSDWELVADLTTLMPFAEFRYGVSFGDYDRDGLPDIGVEPHVTDQDGDVCFHLLHNLGDADFLDIAPDPLLLDVQPCDIESETLCWADVDGDDDLDLFIPVYPPWAFGGPGNSFLENLGPTAPDGSTRFTETSAPAGLDNPPDTARPEGAQFVDVDFDGDPDLFSNGTIYQNVSSPGVPLFVPLPETSSGVGNVDQLEEGALFLDFDMDGDDDLLTVYALGTLGVVIWENRGDGTFTTTLPDLVQSPSIGLGLGASAADWDGDGDVDFTTRQVFRRNMLVETGSPGFTTATNIVDPADLVAATPAWADWDQDGDVDCALGNWTFQGRFYENTLYDATTPDDERRSVRVRVARDATGPIAGLETEYGAAVELRLLGNTDDGLRRRRFVASSAGYLNQDEYVLTFALPPDPAPGDPDEDVSFALVVDFPGLPQNGLHRVDGFVNPALASIALADLAQREIVVFRSGIVRIDGVDVPPDPLAQIPLVTTTGGLMVASASAPLPAPASTPGQGRYVGLAFRTGPDPVSLREILIDGQLDDPLDCPGGAYTVAVWDVEDSAAPFIVPGGRLELDTRLRNDRSRWLVDVPLLADREYRIVAHVKERRVSPVALPLDQGAVLVRGGLDFNDPLPCSGVRVVTAPLDETAVPLAVRIGVRSTGAWADLGFGKPGSAGLVPAFAGFGPMTSGSYNGLFLQDALPGAPSTLVMGLTNLGAPFSGGVLVPSADLTIMGLVVGPDGSLLLPLEWPVDVPPGAELYFQHWIGDPGATFNLSASNGLRATAK